MVDFVRESAPRSRHSQAPSNFEFQCRKNGASMKQITWVALAWLALVATASAAGFDCRSKSLSSTEEMICSDPDLSRLDDELNSSFKLALSESKTEQEKKILLDEQRQWITQVRDKCSEYSEPGPVYMEYSRKVSCLTQAYGSRNGEFQISYEKARQERMLKYELAELSRRSSRTIEEIKEVLSNCDESQLNINVCSVLYSIDAELALESALAEKLESLPPNCRDKLQAAQAKWKEDTYSKCAKGADEAGEGGSMYASLANMCVESSLRSRAAKIRSLKSCDHLH